MLKTCHEQAVSSYSLLPSSLQKKPGCETDICSPSQPGQKDSNGVDEAMDVLQAHSDYSVMTADEDITFNASMNMEKSICERNGGHLTFSKREYHV